MTDLAPRRVRLVRTSDPHTSLTPGAEGTVTHVDDTGTVHVRWDYGGTLGLLPRHDVWIDLCILCGRVIAPGCCPTLDTEDDRP